MKRRIQASESLPQRSPRNALGLAAAAGVGIAVLFGCGSPDDRTLKLADPTAQATAKGTHGKASSASEVGTVGFNLQLGNATVDEGSYTIHGNGFDTSGPIDLSHAPSVSVIVAGVPLGTGYTATMDAHGSANGLGLSCTGSADFDVTSTSMTSVPVPLQCKEVGVAPPVPVPRAASLMLATLMAVSGIVLLGGRLRRRTA